MKLLRVASLHESCLVWESLGICLRQAACNAATEMRDMFEGQAGAAFHAAYGKFRIRISVVNGAERKPMETGRGVM